MKALERTQASVRANIGWSCVLDDSPALRAHLPIWLATLTGCAGVSVDDIVVHHVTELWPEAVRIAKRLGIRTHRIPRFDTRSPHSNKILQCASDFGEARRVVLTDVDLAFLSYPPVDHLPSPVAGKLVDVANPPVEILRDLFREMGLPIPATILKSTALDHAGVVKEFQTFPANYNGGFYVIDRAVLAELGLRWAYWARGLLDAALIPARYAVHVDQISFCMAVHELGLETVTLSAEWNLPSHIQTATDLTPPFAVHHHDQIDEAMCLLPLKPQRHEALIANANAIISTFLQQHSIVPETRSR